MGTPSISALYRRIGPAVLVNLVAPIVVFELIKSTVDNDTVSLAIGAAVPLLWTLGRLVVSRAVDPIGVAGVALYGAGLLVVWLTGGSPLGLELRDAAPTGLIGLACLASVLVGRPLIVPLLRLTKRTVTLDRRSAAMITVLAGATLVTHAAALTVLAMSLSVGSYVAVHQVVGLSIVAAGAAGIWWYRRRIIAAPVA
ncbi:MAG TPA: VC0807 family protein [Pseudonocardiaceae bacterium]|nr:VC0807 family protein [Pseudonocardiaceae bacterium]